MAVTERHGIARYNAGCRCSVCKGENSAYRKDQRRKRAESVGEPLRMIQGDATSEYAASPCVAAVSEAIEGLPGHKRPELAAAALALAAILDNPKAVSTQPAAAAKLSDLMAQIRKSGEGKRSKLASVRSMTSGNVKTG